MNKNYKDIIEYLNLLQKNKERQLENGDFTKIKSVAYGLEIDINAIKMVIEIVKEDVENEFD